ncbi:MAG: type II toxin-antitoxin system PemK/MazF family toxin [Candidatus Eisenbacteria bacterium]|uniref:mRNA interferase n=1 Tax=Eiseniibacteriota bacterium TaxID=2212470 RepID=A0A7Y2E9Y3_UNCEI|nr:type II toxin-antitoxin system PemK/MazF family toxin [Candidatus Eisenbacteria bacterium]
MNRGEIWWAELPNPRGSEPGFRRPVLIVQANAFNASQIRTVIVAAITSNLKLEEAPGNVRLSKRHSKLSKTSVVNVSQLLTIDRCFLVQKACKIPRSAQDLVDSGIRLALDLE